MGRTQRGHETDVVLAEVVTRGGGGCIFFFSEFLLITTKFLHIDIIS
jgi:hypothetical protein